MFYDKFLRLCDEKGVSPTAACMDMKISDGSWRRWREGSSPRGVTIKKICDYFNVSPSTFFDDSDKIEYLSQEEESRLARQELLDNTEMRVLFDATRNVPAYKLYEVAAQLMKWKEDNGISD